MKRQVLSAWEKSDANPKFVLCHLWFLIFEIYKQDGQPHLHSQIAVKRQSRPQLSWLEYIFILTCHSCGIQSTRAKEYTMASTKCKYCGSTSFGQCKDSRHPEGVHEHVTDGQHCVYCGSTSFGQCKDSRHPQGVHQR